MVTRESCAPSANSRARLEELRSGSAEWVGTITLRSTIHSFYSLRKILKRKRARRRPAGPQAPVRSGPALTHPARVSFKIRSREKKLRTHWGLETRRKVRKKAPLLLPQVSRTSPTAARCDSRSAESRSGRTSSQLLLTPLDFTRSRSRRGASPVRFTGV